jgi:alpha-1,2-mannosyltransferase
MTGRQSLPEEGPAPEASNRHLAEGGPVRTDPTPTTSTRLQRYGAFTLAAITVVLALVGFIGILPQVVDLPPKQIDFAAYYLAARVLNTGGGLYDSIYMEQQSLAAGGIVFTPYLYPPFWAHLVRPLALLPYPAAAALWLAANVAGLVLIVVLLGRFVQLKPRFTALYTAGAFLLPAVYDSLLLGQLTILITLLLVGTLTLSAGDKPTRNRELLAGLLIGVAVALKVYPAVILLAFLIHRRIAVIISAGLTVIVAFLAGVLLGGLADTRHWFVQVLPALPDNSTTPVNQSLTGVVQRFLTHSEVFLSENEKVALTSLTHNPTLARFIIYGGILLALSITIVWIVRRQGKRDRHLALAYDFALVIPLTLLITPIAWDSYLVHMLIPLSILVRHDRRPGRRLRFWTICLLLIVHRYWWPLIPYVPSPWLTMFGFSAVVVTWASLLLGDRPVRLTLAARIKPD